MQKAAYFRFIISLLICFTVLSYNVKGMIAPFYAKETVKTEEKKETYSKQTYEEKKEETEKKEEEKKTEKADKTVSSVSSSASKTSSVSSVAVSAPKDVKGKIISQYISPYYAPQSYSKVYMKNSTGVSVDIKKLLEADLGYKISTKSSEVQVLIVHTHATESFMDTDSNYYTSNFNSRSRDNSKNMVKIGDIVAEQLNKAGIKTLHSKTLHDYPEYTGSYSRAKETINWYLKKYPSIKIILDLHRDSISSGSDKIKPVTEIGGKKAAQVMLVMGSGTNGVTGHSKWQENLKLAFKLQQKLETNYPTLARPLMLASKLYNQNLTTGSLLIEFGTDANTLTEASYSAELVGKAMVELFKELEY